jgi:hypothetical protein
MSQYLLVELSLLVHVSVYDANLLRDSRKILRDAEESHAPLPVLLLPDK